MPASTFALRRSRSRSFLLLLVTAILWGCSSKLSLDDQQGPPPPREEEPREEPPPPEEPLAEPVDPCGPAPGPNGEMVTLGGVFGEVATKKWVPASLEPPFETPVRWTAFNSEGPAPAKFFFARDGAAAQEIPWDGPIPFVPPAFGANRDLNYLIEATDGSKVTPRLWVVGGVLRIHSLMHGDIVTVADALNGASDSVCIVKNFTLNDMNRVGFANLTVVGDDLGTNALNARLLATIRFALEDGQGTAQERERTRNLAVFAGVLPPLAVLDVPSARGVGIFPDDLRHFHYLSRDGLPQRVSDAVSARRRQLGAERRRLGFPRPARFNPRLAADRAKLRELQPVFRRATRTAIDVFEDEALRMVFHTYEDIDLPDSYYIGGPPSFMVPMQPDDPLRNIAVLPNGEIGLFRPRRSVTARGHRLVRRAGDTSFVDQFSFFIDRNRRLRFPAASTPDQVRGAMVADALRE